MSIPRLWIVPGLQPSTQASRIACIQNHPIRFQPITTFTRFFRSTGAQLDQTSSSLLGALAPIGASAHLTLPPSGTASSTHPDSASNARVPAPDHPVSSVKAGTPLDGLGFTKNNPDPVALEDHEYPSWLWECLRKGPGSKADSPEEKGDLFSKSKKQRKAAAKQLRKAEIANPGSFAPKIPIQEQTIDLPIEEHGSIQNTLAAQALRGDLTKAMRKKRKASIKEANFLKGMR